MYAGTAIRFRDPFVVSKGLVPHKSTSDHPRSSEAAWHLDNCHQPVPGPSTRAFDMNGYQHFPPQSARLETDDRHSAACMPGQSAQRPPVGASSFLHEANQGNLAGRMPAQTSGRAGSPPRQVHIGAAPVSRRASRADTIADNFQVPKSVNDSGGSLAELAAQITCLFWFESAELLQQVEDSAVPFALSRSLVGDAKPTTGFRKWVTTILSTTMVAQNVVVLALLFIFRLKKLNPTVKGKPGSEYRLLTVALMLGNKFLDDNTYTNKTWAEVSGINVSEVHIMEVEFLSNMKYTLFTGDQDWARWQSLLGKFAAFFDRASRPQIHQPSAPILPHASSLHRPLALPSPPASNNASPPCLEELSQNTPAYGIANQYGQSPAPSPLSQIFEQHISSLPASRKRSLDENCAEPPAKRPANGCSPPRYTAQPSQGSHNQALSRLPLPSLAIPAPQAHPGTCTQTSSPSQQLPPINVPTRAMAVMYPNSAAQGYISQLPASVGTPSRLHSHASSRLPSPTSNMPQSAAALHSSHHVSPTYYLQQRSSPYRPIHDVTTLLCPPPTSATQNRQAHVDLHQMQYQPLGKPVQHTGRLPYVGQNLWIDGSQPQEMTPIHQWPGFASAPQHQHQQPRPMAQ